MCQERLNELEFLSIENERIRKNINEASYYTSWRYIERILNNSNLLKAVALILMTYLKKKKDPSLPFVMSQASTFLMKKKIIMARKDKDNLYCKPVFLFLVIIYTGSTLTYWEERA